MFWDKKEDRKSLPDLPPLKPFFKSFGKEEGVERLSMPSPSYQEESEQEMEMPQRSSAPEVREMGKFSPETKIDDVYVKIERFHTARKALYSAQEKLKEIEEIMKKIRETRVKEERELATWEKDIDMVKSKVEDVTNNIFEKVE